MKKVLFMFFLAIPIYVEGKIYAIFVGVSEYEQSSINLSCCHKDATEMYEMLKDYVMPENMKLLTNRQAKHDDVVFYTKQLFQQARPEDIVIFYFSGHGLKNDFFTHDKKLNFSTLQNIFRQTKAKRKLIFADACYSGSLRQSGSRNNSYNTDMGNNVLLFLSSRSGQRSYEGYILQNSIFTYFLLAAFRGGADANKDSYITAKELFDFVNPKVIERSRGKQIPVMWGKFDENMIILQLKKTSKY